MRKLSLVLLVSLTACGKTLPFQPCIPAIKTDTIGWVYDLQGNPLTPLTYRNDCNGKHYVSM